MATPLYSIIIFKKGDNLYDFLFISLEDVALQKGCTLDPLYTVSLFHCDTFDESICHFRNVGSILSLLFYF